MVRYAWSSISGCNENNYFAFTLCPNQETSLTFKKIALPLTASFLVKLHCWIWRNASFATIALAALLPLNCESLIVTRAPSKICMTDRLLEWFKNNPSLISMWHPDSIVIAEPLIFESNSESIKVMPLSPEWQFEMCTSAAFTVQLWKAMCDIVTPGDLQAQWPIDKKFHSIYICKRMRTSQDDMLLRVCNAVKFWFWCQYRSNLKKSREIWVCIFMSSIEKKICRASLWLGSNKFKILSKYAQCPV